MKRIRINREEVTFIVPPEAAGQTVEVSYALVTEGPWEGMVLRRVYDHADGEDTVTIHGMKGDFFAPWNEAPKLCKKGEKVELY